VNCVLQDSYGFIWFGTDDGLSKYDGYDFAVYKHNPDDLHSLSHNRVWSLFEDSSGVLSIGTYGGGLNRFNRDTRQFTRYDADDFQNVTDEPEEFRNVVWAIDEHPAGVLWIATYGGGLVKFELETGAFTSYAPDPEDPEFWGHEWITALLVDRSGMLWLGTDSEGLDRFDPTTERFTIYRHDPSDPTSLGSDWITAILQDRSGQIWIGTNGAGLDRFDPGRGTFSHYRHNPDDPRSPGDNYIWSLSEDPTGLLWIGTGSGGLEAFDPDNETFVHFRHDPADSRSLSSDRIRWIHQDRSGTLWVGTRGGGVNKSDPASGRFTHYRGDPDDPRRPSDYRVLALLEDEHGTLWIGTASGGLDALDRETGEWRHYRHDPADPDSLGNNSILAMHRDSSGILWLGTEDGFHRFDPDTGRFERLTHNPPDPGDVKQHTIYTIYEDSQGILWLGTHGRGLSAFDPTTGEFAYHLQYSDPEAESWEEGGLSNNWVHGVVEDASGILWIGTQDGLNTYDRETGQWHWLQQEPSDPHSLSHNWVMSLYQDRSGALWVGTLGGGLNRLVLPEGHRDDVSEGEGSDPATGTFVHYTERDGLANDMVLHILEEDRGSLWIATANGLSRYDLRTETFKTYDAGDGLPINEFSAAYASRGGELFFGGINGLLSFYPDQMKDNPYVPPVVLTSLQQNGVAVEAGQAPEDLKAVTLRWPNNSFEFGFVALNYTQPEKNQHAYKLEGFDRSWNYIGNRRFGRYTNLPGGTYALTLKGSNNDGVWNEEGTSIRLTIVPPFWQTWWFWGIVALTLLGSAFGGYRLRVRSLETRSHELQRQVEERTAELRLEVDQRIQAEEALRQREREKAITEERQRLARDLHDAVTQTLFSTSLIAEVLPQIWERNPADGRRRLEQVRQATRSALAEMRTLLLELRPTGLAEADLGDLLRQLADATSGRGHVSVEVEVMGRCSLPPDVHMALYRIAQEALNNIAKHARAGQAVVRLECGFSPAGEAGGTGTATLSITDDGRGFDLNTIPPGRLGLGIMRERAETVGAELEIVSEVGQGTEVRVVWKEEGG
jgi:signal transduction histidine kinase/ligand-binding sensor domain-containing protein